MLQPPLDPGKLRHCMQVVNWDSNREGTGEEETIWLAGPQRRGYLKPHVATRQEEANQVVVVYTHELILREYPATPITEDKNRIVYYPNGYENPTVNEYFNIELVQRVEEVPDYLYLQLTKRKGETYSPPEG